MTFHLIDPLPFPLLIIPSCRKSPSRSFNQTCFLRTFFFTHPYYANLRCFNRKFLVWFWEVAVKKIYSWVLGGCNLEFWIVKDSSPPVLLKMLNFNSVFLEFTFITLNSWKGFTKRTFLISATVSYFSLRVRIEIRPTISAKC